jgi:hypothetical protein
MYSGEAPKQSSKHMRQLRDYIIQWSVYKYSLLINTEVNMSVYHQIDRIIEQTTNSYSGK